MMILQLVACMAAVISFSVLFSAPKSHLIFCGLTGVLGWLVFTLLVMGGISSAPADIVAAFALTIFARLVSVMRKTPVTVYLITGIFPLVPGAGIYYTSYYFIMNDLSSCTSYGIATLKAAGAIVLGILFGFAPPQAWFNALAKRRQRRSNS